MLRCNSWRKSAEPAQNDGGNGPADPSAADAAEFAHLEEQEVRLLIEENELMLAEIVGLREDNRTLHDELRGMRDERDAFAAENERLREQLDRLDQLEDLRVRLAALEADVTDRDELLRERTERIQELEEEGTALERQLEAVSAQRGTLDNQHVAEMTSQLQQLREQATHEERRLQTAAQMLQNAISHIKSFRLDSGCAEGFLDASVASLLKRIADMKTRFSNPSKVVDQSVLDTTCGRTVLPQMFAVVKLACDLQWQCAKFSEVLVRAKMQPQLAAINDELVNGVHPGAVPSTPRGQSTQR